MPQDGRPQTQLSFVRRLMRALYTAGANAWTLDEGDGERQSMTHAEILTRLRALCYGSVYCRLPQPSGDGELAWFNVAWSDAPDKRGHDCDTIMEVIQDYSINLEFVMDPLYKACEHGAEKISRSYVVHTHD